MTGTNPQRYKSPRRRAQVPDVSECPCSGRTLPRLVQPAVMAVLDRGEAHGYEIGQRLEHLHSFAIQPADYAGIYRALNQMERDGYLISRWDTSEAGPARKVFRLTSSGRSCLGQWSRTLRAYRSDLDELLKMVGPGR